MPNDAPGAGSLRLAIDAGNLARDRRGMGRIARGVVRAALAESDLALTLLIDDAAAADAARSEFPGVSVAPATAARRTGRFDVVWYPFNGMRFPSASPSVVTIHDAFAFTEAHREPVARRREQGPIRRAARYADQIVTDSDWSRAEIARELDLAPDAIAVIRPSPDPYWFPGPAGRLPAPLANVRFVLLVGARERRKNARTALVAAGRALRPPGEILAVVGELSKPDRAFARAGRVPVGEIAAGDALLRELYRSAALVLVPSLAEGFGLVAIEAMACGAAVIAANTTALPEATAGAAVLLDPRDSAMWAGAVRTLLDDSARLAALRARGAARFAYADRGASSRATIALLRSVARARA